ncbi:thermonuclease family protein [Fusobacterium sp. HC1336]|uniref:thermonuclease family protein n=1 Tax=Fusobacterium sp. HC1336 TaxID=3171169 RepID=UPI003F212F60
MKKIFTIILSLILSIFSYALDAYVEKVSDGDSFVVKANGKKMRVRMYGIDAPELKQKHGVESKKYLESLILKKTVELKVLYEDKYKRKVARVYSNNKEINLEMLRSGNAWFYEYHAGKEKSYRKAYEEAKKEKRGLWKDKNPENPRDYRLKNKREE